MTQGIYVIRFKGCNKIYIGESTNMEQRWEVHQHQLENGDHINYKLRECYKKFGTPSFEIVEKVHNYQALKDREEYYINKYNTFDDGLNLTFKSITPKSVQKYNVDQLREVFNMLAEFDLHKHTCIEKHTKVDLRTIRLIEDGTLHKFLHNADPVKSKDITIMIPQRARKNADGKRNCSHQ